MPWRILIKSFGIPRNVKSFVPPSESTETVQKKPTSHIRTQGLVEALGETKVETSDKVFQVSPRYFTLWF